MKLLRKLHFLLDRRAKRQLPLLFFIMIVGACLEALGIGLIFPFIALVNDPASVNNSSFLRWLYESSGAGTPRSFLLYFAVALIGTFVIKNLFLAFMHYAQYRFAFRSQIALSRRLLGHYLRKPYVFHLQRNSAELLRNTNSEALWVFNHVVVPLIQVATEGFVLVLIAAVLFVVSPLATLMAVALLGGVGGLFYWLVKRKMKALGKRQQHHMGEMIKWVNQGLGGIKETKVRGSEDFFVNAYTDNSRAYANANIFLKTMSALPRLLIETLGFCAILAGAILVIARGDELMRFLPHLALFAMASIRVMPSVNRIVVGLTGIQFFYAAVDVISRDLDAAGSAQPSCSDSSERPLPVTLERSIRLKNICFRYPERDRQVLDDVSLEIAKGSSVGFVGSSGAGKTTLLNVVLGLLTPDAGVIETDDRRIDENLGGWQRLIGYVPQDVYLLDDTIRRNISFGLPDSEIDEDGVWRALAAAQLKAFVGDMDEGLDTLIGEHGVRLSGGQRQRLGIARALYHEPEVLVFDEATSSLDYETEREIQRVIAELRGDKTLILVAHRLTTLVDCDLLFFLKDGKVAASGGFEQLKAQSADFQALLRASESERVSQSS